jgi:hypothetical protein
MQQIRRLIGAIVLGLFAAGYAHAVTYSVVFTNGSYLQRHDKIPKGPFEDIFKFSLSSPTNLTVAVPRLEDELLNVSLFVDGSTDYGWFNVTKEGTVGTFALLAGSNYEIRVKGTSLKSNSSDARYELRLTAASMPQAPLPPVPEPAEWTLLLAGFLVIGFIVRRRNRHIG